MKIITTHIYVILSDLNLKLQTNSKLEAMQETMQSQVKKVSSKLHHYSMYYRFNSVVLWV